MILGSRILSNLVRRTNGSSASSVQSRLLFTSFPASSSTAGLSRRDRGEPVLFDSKKIDSLIIGSGSNSVRSLSKDTNFAPIWNAEKAVTCLAIPSLVLPFLYTTPLTDAIFCITILLHAHWGLEGVVVDYVRPVLFGGSNVIPKLTLYFVYTMSILALAGLLNFNYSDVGIVKAIKMLWSL